jgi:hypothetical protein
LPLARLALLLTGIFVVWLGWAQPDWASTRLWQRSFGHHYFAAVMLLTAIWGFGMTLLSGSIVPSLIGAMACAAGIASFSTAPEART